MYFLSLFFIALNIVVITDGPVTASRSFQIQLSNYYVSSFLKLF